MANFVDFLSRNIIQPGGTLPLVHSTSAYHFTQIAESEQIIARQCDVFTSDRLNYFFVGRPAFKATPTGVEASEWELPCCLIFEFTTLSPIKRVFPFDSGAYAKGKYPHYIGMMGIEKFESSSVPDAPSKIIGAFFGSPADYFAGRVRNLDEFKANFDVGLLQAEALAVHRLASDRGTGRFDDRRLSVELQSDADIDLKVNRPLAVIAPTPYLDVSSIRDTVVNKWKAQPLNYPVHSLSVDAYYNDIYTLTSDFYKTKGFL